VHSWYNSIIYNVWTISYVSKSWKIFWFKRLFKVICNYFIMLKFIMKISCNLAHVTLPSHVSNTCTCWTLIVWVLVCMRLVSCSDYMSHKCLTLIMCLNVPNTRAQKFSKIFKRYMYICAYISTNVSQHVLDVVMFSKMFKKIISLCVYSLSIMLIYFFMCVYYLYVRLSCSRGVYESCVRHLCLFIFVSLSHVT